MVSSTGNQPPHHSEKYLGSPYSHLQRSHHIGIQNVLLRKKLQRFLGALCQKPEKKTKHSFFTSPHGYRNAYLVRGQSAVPVRRGKRSTFLMRGLPSSEPANTLGPRSRPAVDTEPSRGASASPWAEKGGHSSGGRHTG